jgi:hypothetical protein
VTTLDWAGLARQALLHHATRGDAAQALSQLRRKLAGLRGEAAIAWRADGAPVWIDGVEPARHDTLGAVWAGAAAQRDASHWWLPLDQLGERIGVLCLRADAHDDAAHFEPLAEPRAAAQDPARRRHLRVGVAARKRRSYPTSTRVSLCSATRAGTWRRRRTSGTG